MRRYSWLLVILAIILVITPILSSCSSPGNEAYLRGWINPFSISGATVKVLDSSGKVLQETQNATLDSGTFLIAVNNLPADFRVVVSGGTMDKQPFRSELQADFRSFNPAVDIAYLDSESVGQGENPTPTPVPTEGSAGVWIAQQLAAGVLSYIAGQSFGSLLDCIGGGGDTTAQDILNALSAIQTQLVNLQNQVKDLADKLNATEYNTAVRMLDPLINVIQSTYKQLNYYGNTPITDADKRKKDQADLMSIIRTQIMTQPNQIHDFLVGSGQTQGLVQLWSKIVASKGRYFTPYDSAKQQAMFDYFDQLQALQLELIVEFYHANKDSAAMMNDAIANYNKNRAEEAALLPPKVPVGGIVLTPSRFSTSQYGDVMLYPQAGKQSYTDALTQIYSTGNFLGFTKWQTPKNAAWSDNITTTEMFAHDEGGSYKDYASSRGWPSELWYDNFVFWCGDTTGDGQSAFDATGHGATIIPENANAYVVAVRRLVQGEWYFYK